MYKPDYYLVISSYILLRQHKYLYKRKKNINTDKIKLYKDLQTREALTLKEQGILALFIDLNRYFSF